MSKRQICMGVSHFFGLKPSQFILQGFYGNLISIDITQVKLSMMKISALQKLTVKGIPNNKAVVTKLAIHLLQILQLAQVNETKY